MDVTETSTKITIVRKVAFQVVVRTTVIAMAITAIAKKDTTITAIGVTEVLAVVAAVEAEAMNKRDELAKACRR